MPDDEFRGLTHIVEVWRNLSFPEETMVRLHSVALASILDRAVAYVDWIESQASVNEEGLPGGGVQGAPLA